jgi:hypothetical protein
MSADAMKLPLVCCLLIAVGVAAFATGYFAAPSLRAPDAAAAQNPDASSTKAETVSIGSRFESRGSSVSTRLTGEQARIRSFELLAESNRLARLSKLCELLGTMTTENWREVIDGCVRQTLSSGRTNPEEWRLVLERVGEIAGATALDEALASTKRNEKDRARSFLVGWGAADPIAARDWFEAQQPETQSLLMIPLIHGLARSDPQTALTYAATSPELRDNFAPQIVNGMMQIGGSKGAEELLSEMNNRADIPLPVKGAVLYHMAARQIELARMRGEPAAVLDWADHYVGPNLMGPAAVREVVTFAAQADAPGTLDWILARTDRWTAEQAAPIFPAIVQAMQAQAPEQLVAWMDANVDHPQHDAMAQAAGNLLLQQGNFEQARRWAEALRDVQARSKLQQAIINAEVNARRVQQNRLP